MDNQTGQASPTDYDLKFQEDLERAQALSLESLALEKFRLQKLERLGAKESSTRIASVLEESENENATSQKEATSVQIKARPRPGSFNSGGPRPAQIIAPPPSAPRRNSASAAVSSHPNRRDIQDLISFGSPSPPEKTAKHRITYEELTEPTPFEESSPKSRIVQNLFPDVSNSGATGEAFLASETLNTSAFPGSSFQPHSQITLDRLYPQLPVFPLQYPDNNAIGWNPTLFSTNIYPQLSPSLSMQSNPYPNPISRISRPLAINGLNDPNFEVFKCLGKKDNNNLIDLTPFRLIEDGAQNEGKDSVRISILEAFDPLLLSNPAPSSSNPVPSTSAPAEQEQSTRDAVSASDDSEPKHKKNAKKMAEGSEVAQPDGEYNFPPPRPPARPSKEDDMHSEGSSVYDVHDPWDFMNALPSQCFNAQGEPIYATVVKDSPRKTVVDSPERESAVYAQPPPLPPRSTVVEAEEKRQSIYKRRSKTKSRLYENIQVVKLKCAHHDSDLKAFHEMVKKLRAEFVYSDSCTNVGLVISPTLESTYTAGTSIKLIVRSKGVSNPITFTCDVTSTVEHVILHVVCEIEERVEPTSRFSSASSDDFVLKVSGLAEYLSSHSCLADYEYVHQCMKLEKDVLLTLIPLEQLKRPLARTLQDDKRDSLLTLDDLLPNEPVQPISYDSLLILLETLESEMEKVMSAALQISSGSSGKTSLQYKGVIQTVKAVTSLLGSVETIEITYAILSLSDACQQLSATPVVQDTMKNQQDQSWPEILTDNGDYSIVTLRKSAHSSEPGGSRHTHEESLSETISVRLDHVREAVNALIETYCHAFRVDFQLKPRSDLPTMTRSVVDVMDPLLVHVEALHRPMQGWAFYDYYIICQVYHGTRPVQSCMPTSPVRSSSSFYERIVFDCWLEIDDLKLCLLPRESRLVLTLYGRTLLPPEESGNSSSDGEPSARGFTTTELGWVALQLFNYNGILAQGSFFLSMWPVSADKILGPAPAPGTHPLGDFHPVIGIELPDYGGRVVFPSEIVLAQPIVNDFTCLDHTTQLKLIQIVEQDMITRCPRLDETDKYKTDYDKCDVIHTGTNRLLLWEHRHYLHSKPEALPKVLLLAPSWDWSCLPDLHSMLNRWTPLDPLGALQLLLPCFPDTEVRKIAIRWVRSIGCDELVDYLPQLVQALKHEAWEASPLAHFLLEWALTSPRVAHYLYWLLTQILPGQSPQNNLESPTLDERFIGEARYHRRLQLMLRALMAISGEAMSQRFFSQQLLVKRLYEVAENLKNTKESLRLENLGRELAGIHHELQESPTCLPLSPSLEVVGIQVKSCSYFPSFTLPLKLNFISSEEDVDGSIVPAIFKVGDDLQQDMLTLQIVRIMDKLWLKEGLDLKIVTFTCVPTGHRRGMMEMITNAETLRKIQVELGLTGSFKDRPIAEWLAKHNPSTLEYERAVENFTASCAGYSVATYILGICDRHNDNIMLKTSGHLFHIDFGKFLGDAQMFGNFKRDRTPFVLTSDMAYVINGGDKPTEKFHHFVDMCCQAFNIIRRNGNLLLNLFALMAPSGIPGVRNAVSYVQKSLLPGLSEDEAAAEFSKMIQSSLRSWFTQFNFFLHNLAQLRFTGDHNDGELLSFIPKTYTMQSEGRIRNVMVFGYQKRYDPEKYYVYILKVKRENQPDPVYLYRSYKEFCELYQKLCLRFPLVKCLSLSSGYHVGRSNIKQVAEKRKVEIERFLKSLLRLADEISHSDLVYTFFHPLLRDQQEADVNAKKLKGVRETQPIAGNATSNTAMLKGQLKLSISYSRGSLSIMVHHARSLSLVGNQEPSAYVKVYLLPDPSKATKRKTKVVRRNSHPTFMEMMEYYMSLDSVVLRTLQATVWNHDSLQENEFLGGVSLPLDSIGLPANTLTEWFPLVNVHR